MPNAKERLEERARAVDDLLCSLQCEGKSFDESVRITELSLLSLISDSLRDIAGKLNTLPVTSEKGEE